MICPHCKQDAPTIARGLQAYCTACGAPRSLLSNTPVNVAGQPSKVGGGVASVLGWMVLVGGVLVALLLGALFQAIMPAGIFGYVLGGIVAGLGLLLGLGLIFGGRKLVQSGTERERSAHEQAVFALARRHSGVVTAAELARAIAISVDKADALLTDMVKRPEGRVTLEVEDDGTLRYTVPEFMPGRWTKQSSERPRVQVDGPRVATDAADIDALAETEVEAEAEAEARRRGRL